MTNQSLKNYPVTVWVYTVMVYWSIILTEDSVFIIFLKKNVILSLRSFFSYRHILQFITSQNSSTKMKKNIFCVKFTMHLSPGGNSYQTDAYRCGVGNPRSNNNSTIDSIIWHFGHKAHSIMSQSVAVSQRYLTLRSFLAVICHIASHRSMYACELQVQEPMKTCYFFADGGMLVSCVASCCSVYVLQYQILVLETELTTLCCSQLQCPCMSCLMYIEDWLLIVGA